MLFMVTSVLKLFTNECTIVSHDLPERHGELEIRTEFVVIGERSKPTVAD